MARTPFSPSSEVNGLSKKRSKKCRVKTTKRFMRATSFLGIRAWTSRESTGFSGDEKIWNALCMGGSHDFDHFAGHCLRVLLLDQLSEDAFEAGQLHELRQLRGRSVGADFSLR